MALQDGLLSFAIKETIFLSSDKAGIGDLQELELVPDVEVLENETNISITGCLQLYGKYEPIRDTATNSGGTETLVEAMTFSPFRPEGSEGPYYGWEEQINHRIPLNITIPLERIAEIGDIYAIVDSFDYKLETPHQMLIEAELKIVGIVFAEQAPEQQPQPQPQSQFERDHWQTEPPRKEEAWEFAHVAVDLPDRFAQPASLEEIEQKLHQLEREMERQAQPVSYDSAESASLYDVPALPVSAQEGYSSQEFGEVAHEDDDVAQTASYQEETAVESPGSWQAESTAYESVSYDSVAYESEVAEAADDQQELSEASKAADQNDEMVLAIHDHQEADYSHVASEEQEEAAKSDVRVAEVAEVAEVEEEIDDEVEVRVAISGKASREEAGGNLNITSIFSQASRAKQEAEALEAESSSSSSRKGVTAGANPSTLEAMHNLTSFVRRKEERSSQLKMCIIQRDETLEQISQRYALPVSKIVEVNRLATEQLVAGQILYIPQ
jgi:stage VI sporulation protein D